MEQIRIDLVPGGVTPNAHASQYDVGRGIRFLLYNGGSTYTLAGTETITVDVTKPDGTTDTVSVTNTSSNYVDFVTTDGLLNQAGLYPCEISIVDGGTEIGSQNFNLRAEADAYDGADIVTVTVGPADICTFTTTLAEPLQSVIVNVLATGGNGTPDNPNPINGYTEANITRCGVNLWNEEWEVGNIDGTGADSPANDRIRSKGYIQVKGTNAVYLVIPTAVVVHKYGIDKSYLGNNYVASSGSFSIASDVAFIRFRTDTSYGTTYNNDISINYPSTDTAYTPYNGDTVTIAFGQTVYGGVLDVTRGKLTVTWGGIDLGEQTWTYNSSNSWRSPIVDSIRQTNPNARPNWICSHYPISTQNNPSFPSLSGLDWFTGVCFWSTDYSTAEQVKTAMSGVILAYELATPFDIDLTPEVISAIVGTNNVFADCGQTTVKYLKAGD